MKNFSFENLRKNQQQLLANVTKEIKSLTKYDGKINLKLELDNIGYKVILRSENMINEIKFDIFESIYISSYEQKVVDENILFLDLRYFYTHISGGDSNSILCKLYINDRGDILKNNSSYSRDDKEKLIF